ncbi:hypothetical protein [Bradyrhizobium sp. WSM1743]|uniref:hypothetical protein n=1 Tax=Bradyrhizobium sp. WSM1743 TaxID=318996 RepID=UPI0012ECAECC|nr:hypothetical protein [Bradyrhizobium sp. WSM1743]
MTIRALPSAVGDIVLQRRINLAAACRLHCGFSLNDNFDGQLSVSLAGPQLLFFEPIRSACGLDQQPPAIASQSSINCDSFDDSFRLGFQSGRLHDARAIHINDARRRSAQDTEDSL